MKKEKVMCPFRFEFFGEDADKFMKCSLQYHGENLIQLLSNSIFGNCVGEDVCPLIKKK